ncbi:MAG: hypothetical protein HQK83_02460 [Fibrobacteria bacterium]|nr:hypothetical protein [Fibrobacteria bacterium]
MKSNTIKVIIFSFLGLMVVLCFGIKAANDNDSFHAYETEWAKVDELYNKKGLPQSALKLVDAIAQKAEAEKNSIQSLKALIHKLRFMQEVEEESLVKIQDELNAALKQFGFAEKAVLHSMIAEQYWAYYQRNRYRFLDRTHATEIKDNDIRTWDLRKIVSATVFHYTHSLDNALKLQTTDINLFKPILFPGNADSLYRPTLYDFLAYRAIEFFRLSEASLTRPADAFSMNRKEYFATTRTFSLLKIETQDTLSFHYRALCIMQKLLAFHLKTGNINALVSSDLVRLGFVNEHGVIDNKNSLYETRLRGLRTQFSNVPAAAEISCELANFKYTLGSKYDKSTTPHYRWLTKEAHNICSEAVNQFPGSFGAKQCATLMHIIENKTLDVTLEKAVPPEQPFPVLIKFTNMNQLFLRIVKLNQKEWLLLEKGNYDERKNLKKEIYKRDAILQWREHLPDTKDFQTMRAEIKIKALKKGRYILLASNKESLGKKSTALCYSLFQVTGLSCIGHDDNHATQQLTIVNRETGLPLKEVTLQLFRQQWEKTNRQYVFNKAYTYKSDKQGDIVIDGQDKKQHVYYYTLIHQDDTLEVGTQFGNRYGSSKERVYTHTRFFTDRSIYRPGQTVYFKGIMYKTHSLQPEKNGIIARTATEVTLKDVNYQKVSSLKLRSNDYGSFSGSFQLPEGQLNGSFTISNAHGSISFSVEEYKRPKFEVKFDDLNKTYKLDEIVKVKGSAKALAGYNIDNAEVRYRIVREAFWPYWRRWWGGYPSSASMEIKNGKIMTGSKGEFTISFKAIPDRSLAKKDKPAFRYKITADITDKNGETRSGSQVVTIGYTSLRLSLDVDEAINRNKGKLSFGIKASNLSGNPVPAKGSYTVYHLQDPGKIYKERYWELPDTSLLSKKEHSQSFPHLAHNQENDFHHWEKESIGITGNFNTEDTNGNHFDIANRPAGKYLIEAVSLEKSGDTIRDISYLTLYDDKAKATPYTTQDWFLPQQEKVEPGEEAKFLIGTSDTAVMVFYQIEHRNKVTARKRMTLSNEQRQLVFHVKENHRGNFSVSFIFIKHNRVYTHNQTIVVPWSNKELSLRFETFKDKLTPGEKEEWRLIISGPQKDRVASEMVATLYDASLDAFRSHHWDLNIFSTFYPQSNFSNDNWFGSKRSQSDGRFNKPFPSSVSRTFNRLNWFGFNWSPHRIRNGRSRGRGSAKMESRAMAPRSAKKSKAATGGIDDMLGGLLGSADAEVTVSENFIENVGSLEGVIEGDAIKHEEELSSLDKVKARTNLNETAFFYPHLKTDKEGNVIIAFTMPEALTRWRMIGLAHTKSLQTGVIEKSLITQKELMVVPNAPRFLRENDKLVLTAKVTNLSNNLLEGRAKLMLFDAASLKPIENSFNLKNAEQNITIKPEGSALVKWQLNVPDNASAITYRIVANAGQFSDGEENILPVLKNRMLVTETMPLPVGSAETKNFTFTKLRDANQSNTLKHHKLTLEFTSNPAWYAVQSLPYLMEYPYECNEQVFSRYYANSLASHIVNNKPKIKQVFNTWKKGKGTPALLSNLEKNQELKSLLLQETPWVMDAKNEAERKKRIALLFDLNKMGRELGKAWRKLEKGQLPSGAWPWFNGMYPNRYITQHIITGLAHLKALGVKDEENQGRINNVISRALRYLDEQIAGDYDHLINNKIELDKKNLRNMQIHYLYARSYFKDNKINKKHLKAFAYYRGQAKTYWLDFNRYLQGMIAITLNRYDDPETSKEILASIKEHALYSEEMGMYWKDSYGYYWHQAPIETHALMIEAFHEITGDPKSVDGLKTWLIKSKQTQDWGTTKATADACYALLLQGDDWLENSKLAEITIGNTKLEPEKMEDVKVEAGTGYFKTSWSGKEINPEMAKVTVVNKNKAPAWGALYWQYFEQLDKITAHDTPLKLKKKFFLEQPSKTGPVLKPISSNTTIKQGDRIKVRIELRVDRDMEFVHMKDMRASGFEPENVISRFKWQDGLGYYESTKDASTNFFMDRLPKGTYVFEYPLRVSHSGDFSNGVTSIQCMYAPEFASHSEGVRVLVK